MLRRHPRALVVLAGALLSLGAIFAVAPVAVAAGNPSATSGNGLTVSWLPTNQPAQIVPGKPSTSHFWVTNDADQPVPVTISPATAVPGNDGSLNVTTGADKRFPSITFSPNAFTAAPHSTTEVTTTIVSPSDLPPGAYLLPAVVKPVQPTQAGNIKIERSIVALTTFQRPGNVDVHLSAALLASLGRTGVLTRKLPGLPRVVMGNSGAATLRVTSSSSAGIYAYYEVRGKQSPFGTIALTGHTSGAPADARGQPALYFPGNRRDFPLSWNANPLGAGVDKITAYVSFNPEPTEVRTISVSATVLVISPWWLLLPIAVLAVMLLALFARRRRAARPARRHRRAVEQTSSGSRLVWRVLGTVVCAVIALVLAALATYWLLAAAVGLLLVCLIAGMLRAPMASLVAFVSALLVVGGLATLIVTALGDLSPGYAVTLLSAAAVGVIAAAWMPRRVAPVQAEAS